MGPEPNRLRLETGGYHVVVVVVGTIKAAYSTRYYGQWTNSDSSQIVERNTGIPLLHMDISFSGLALGYDCNRDWLRLDRIS